MKSNSTKSTATTKNSSTKSSVQNKKNTARNMDTAAATEKVRSRHTHGHSGMNNEGTSVDYEEQR